MRSVTPRIATLEKIKKEQKEKEKVRIKKVKEDRKRVAKMLKEKYGVTSSKWRID